MVTMQAEMKEMVLAHERFIAGNGQPGARDRLTGLEVKFCNMDEKLDRMQGTLDKAFGWVVAASLTFVTGVLVWFFTIILPKIV